MSKQPYKAILIADFNLQNLAGYLSNDQDSPLVEAITAPFGQVTPILIQPDLACWQYSPDFAVIWTQPEGVIESFDPLLRYEPASIQNILTEVDNFATLILNIADRVKTILVPTWIFPSYHRGMGLLEMKTGVGIANTLMRMNLRLAEDLNQAPNIYLLNAQKWLEVVGKNAFNSKLWYLSKTPFGNDLFVEAVKDVKAALRGVNGLARKLILLDLDDTLWGGIVGDVGWENIRLGGHDHIGEAFVDFQKALKSLTNRGVLLGIVSKNEEAVALAAIKNHPEMVLQLEDFAGWRINWQDKAQNIIELVSELNLGLQSVVFIDDNPFEQARVRETLPEVFVPDWPENKMLYRQALVNLRVFDTPSITIEDRARAKMYVSDRQRRDFQQQRVGSIDEWLKGLNIKVEIEEINPANLQRVTQLFNKTNQMNLTTRRMSESELKSWAQGQGHSLWAFRVADKFGDLGLVGIITLEVRDSAGKIIDFVLSCRAMGRQVEEAMLHTVVHNAQTMGLTKLVAEYLPTAKNKPCLEFWQRSGFHTNHKGAVFTWKIGDDFPLPDHIELVDN